MSTFITGQRATAIIPVSVQPAGLDCQIELFLGPVTSGLIGLISGTQPNISIPITMPASPGTYPVYARLYTASKLVAERQDEDVTITTVQPSPIYPFAYSDPWGGNASGGGNIGFAYNILTDMLDVTLWWKITNTFDTPQTRLVTLYISAAGSGWYSTGVSHWVALGAGQGANFFFGAYAIPGSASPTGTWNLYPGSGSPYDIVVVAGLIDSDGVHSPAARNQ